METATLLRYERALRSIADNACCDSCREAALVAQDALNVEEIRANLAQLADGCVPDVIGPLTVDAARAMYEALWTILSNTEEDAIKSKDYETLAENIAQCARAGMVLYEREGQ